jgi:chromosome segregation ATPase
MFDERIKVEDQLNRVILNLDKVIRFNEMTQKDHEAEMKRIGSKEEILKVLDIFMRIFSINFINRIFFKKQISELKKQLNEERFKTSTIMAKMNVEGEDYKRNLEDYTIQKAQFEKKRVENDVRLDKLQRKVDEIETIKLNTDLECYNLEKALTDTVSDHNKLETSLTSKLNELEPKHEKVFNIYAENKQNLDYVKKHTQEMKEKMEQMAKSKDIMIKTIQKISEEIEELKYLK